MFDSIFLAGSMERDERQATVHRILGALQAQDYLGSVFVNERTCWRDARRAPRATSFSMARREGLPDIVVVFASSRGRRGTRGRLHLRRRRYAVGRRGEGIADVFSRTGTAIFMAARGPDFRAGVNSSAPASNADMRRTIAELLDLDLDSGGPPNTRVLREALAGGENRKPPEAVSQTLSSPRSDAGLVTDTCNCFPSAASLTWIRRLSLIRTTSPTRMQGGAGPRCICRDSRASAFPFLTTEDHFGRPRGMAKR